MAGPRPIAHLPALVGACTAGYALALAFVTGQQAAADARIVAARAPMEEAIQRSAAQRAETSSAVTHAGTALERTADGYAEAMQQSSMVDEALAALAARVEAATGAAARLPDRVPLPAPAVRVVQVAAPPATQAVTGGSGR